MAYQTGFNSSNPISHFPQSPGQAQNVTYNYAPTYSGPPSSPPPSYGSSYSPITLSAPSYESHPVAYTTYGQAQTSVTDLALLVTQTVRQEFQQEINQLRDEVRQSQDQTQEMCRELRERVDYLSYVEDDRRSTTQHLCSLGGAFLGAAFGGPVVAVTTVVGAFGGSALGYVGGTAMHENSSGSVARREEIQASKKYLDILQTKA